LLAPHFRVIAMDCRGHGRSGKPHEVSAYSGTTMEDDVTRLMDHLRIERALLQGYSMGARIALGLLARQPKRFGAVVLGGIGATGQMDDPERRKAIAASLLADDKASVSRQGRDFRQFAESVGNDLNALAACMSANRAPVDPAVLAKNTVPALVIVGTKDELAMRGAKPLQEQIANSKLIEIEGRHHLNAPGDRKYQAEVLGFLKSAPA
ncbi:MAG TPA: alpha/beta fold hydrolase, partial [Candidatus Binataceae bacterium]|nr:alpha/beta fold hydrolase [Candidatus Binataceae bacterium]